MKQLGSILPILLLLGVGITSGLADAGLTASQQVLPQIAAVGETATVTLTLAYSGGNTTQIMVVPILPPGIVTDMPGDKVSELNSGSSLPISYPIRAVESGSYLITSQISYTEEKTTRRLNMVSEFTATGGSPPTTPLKSIPMASGSQLQGALQPSASPIAGNGQPSNPESMTPGSMPYASASPAVTSLQDGDNSSTPR